MRKLIIIFLIFNYFQSLPGNPIEVDFKEEFYKELIKLIDSSRNVMYKEKWYIYSIKDGKRWFDFETSYDTLGSISCYLNNLYRKKLMFNEKIEERFVFNQNERSKICSNGQFNSVGECFVSGGLVFSKIKPKEFSKIIFDELRKSKNDWEVLMWYGYVDMGIDLMVDESGLYWVTINVGYKKGRNIDFKFKKPKNYENIAKKS